MDQQGYGLVTPRATDASPMRPNSAAEIWPASRDLIPALDASGRGIEPIGSVGFDGENIVFQLPSERRVPRCKFFRIGRTNFIVSMR